MIDKLKRNLYLLFLSSIMFIFSIVLLILIYENLESRRKTELAYFNRMATILVLQLEHTTDFKKCMEPYEEKHSMSFQLLSEFEVPLYQSEQLKDNLDTVKSFLTKLANTQNSFTLNRANLKDEYYSSLSGAYTIKAPDGKYYYCVNCFITAKDNNIYTLTILKECSTSIALLWPSFIYYFIIWFGFLICMIIISRKMIAKAVKPAENAIQSQKAFISAVSHECKAPLAVILSSAEMIDAMPEASNGIKKYVHMIDSEVSHMSRLIQDLLLLSSIDAGSWTLHREKIDIDTLMINLYTKFNFQCQKKNISLLLTIPEKSCPPLYSDEYRLNQLIGIFLDNAIAYSRPESEIALISAIEKNELAITVLDHGIGISDEDKPFIFNRFYQCDRSHTRKEHFGLGLSIADEIIHMLGGKIQLSDTAGGGCTFQILLPIYNPLELL